VLDDMDEFEVEVSSTTPSNGDENAPGTCGSVHNIHSFRRNDFSTPSATSTAPHGAKLTAAIIAARRLKYNLKPGIGKDEPAKNVAIEHYPFPEPSPRSAEEAMGMTFAVPDSASHSDDQDYGPPGALPKPAPDDEAVGMTFAVPDSSSDSDSDTDSNFTLTFHAPDSDEHGHNCLTMRFHYDGDKSMNTTC
jgi:hypothetical protein